MEICFCFCCFDLCDCELFQTPLMLAAMHGNVSCVERLIQLGANVCEFRF